MNLIQRLEKWGDAHHPKWLDVVRIVLGAFLFLKGLEFISNMNAFSELMAKSGFLGLASTGIVAHIIVFAHLIGGILVAVGLLTRFACLIQIPILLGAIVFVNAQEGILKPHAELWLSVVFLLLLVFFFIEGSGPISVDEVIRRNPEKKEWHG
ncbi:MAG TPA: DoxX family protein [Chitinophagaceae bacterium]|nr:DoxX family protein [Chitinophagaceae bacterium]